MKSILVPTDFSANAANAYRYALAIAAHTGAKVKVLHVIYPNEGVDNNIYNAFWADDYLEQRKKELLNWVNRNKKTTEHKAVKVNTEFSIGFPVPTIAEKADEMKADLIVMGTTGATGLRGAFLGSIASGVIHHTQIPVLAIPPKVGLLTGQSAVYATDFRFKVFSGSLKVLEQILQLRQSDLKIVHILDKPGEQPDPVREQAIQQKMKGISHDFHYLHDRDIPQAVANYLESVNGGLLVTVAHDHSVLHRLFYDSVTSRLAHRTKVPLLVFHDN